MTEDTGTNPMSFDEHLLAVYQTLEKQAEMIETQAIEMHLLRLRVKRLEETLERLPTQPLE